MELVMTFVISFLSFSHQLTWHTANTASICCKFNQLLFSVDEITGSLVSAALSAFVFFLVRKSFNCNSSSSAGVRFTAFGNILVF